MNIQSLNVDTLDAIFTHISSREALKLSATARIFYATARRHAVKDVTTHSPGGQILRLHDPPQPRLAATVAVTQGGMLSRDHSFYFIFNSTNLYSIL